MCTALYMGTIIGIYQVWEFIKPGLHKCEKKKYLGPMMLSSATSIISGVIVYCVVLPTICQFFLSFEISKPIQIHLEARIYTYTQMVEKIVVLSQTIFQVPTLIYICIRVGILTHKALIE